MKTYLDCIPCFIRQGLEAARMVTDDDRVQLQVIKKIMNHLMSVELTSSPPEISYHVHKIIRESTGSPDPYKKIKQSQNKFALGLYPKLKKLLDNSDDRLLTAIKLAIAGNVIDYGAAVRFDVESTIQKVLTTDFTINAYDKFKNYLSEANKLLYIGDNAGEIVFDMLLVEELINNDLEITFAVKPGPIINDATLEDAHDIGLDRYAKLITTGAQTPGVVLESCSSEFIEHYESADMIIAKGQGNYEGLGAEPNLFKLLMVKCELVAREIGDGVKVGDIIFINI